MRLAFIGGGVMAEAIISGIQAAGLKAEITVGEPDASRRDALTRRNVRAVASNDDAAKSADIIVLAVKPQLFDKIAGGLKLALRPDQTVMSIMAGVKLNSIALKLGHSRVVRVMPNTPAQVRQGISAWTASPEVSAEHCEFIASVLSAIGEEVRFDEEKYVDMATALSASGPAFAFIFLEALTDAGVQMGMTNAAAKKLASKMVSGSVALLTETGKHPAELRNMVTSPGGTTAAGIFALEQAGFRAAVISAVLAAYKRGEELGALSK